MSSYDWGTTSMPRCLRALAAAAIGAAVFAGCAATSHQPLLVKCRGKAFRAQLYAQLGLWSRAYDEVDGLRDMSSDLRDPAEVRRLADDLEEVIGRYRNAEETGDSNYYLATTDALDDAVESIYGACRHPR
jgi:hypothetical protein